MSEILIDMVMIIEIDVFLWYADEHVDCVSVDFSFWVFVEWLIWILESEWLCCVQMGFM